MRILQLDRKSGKVKILIETPDDLWHIFNVIETGDAVFGVTYRREEQRSDAIRSEKREKKRMFLGIKVEDSEFREFTDHLRIKGVIVEGPQDHGQHHSLEFESGNTIELVKEEWRPWMMNRLREAERDTKRSKVLLVALDDEEATIASLWQYGVQTLAVIRHHGGGKQYGGGGDRKVYYGEVLACILQNLGERALPILVVGPGFYKEELLAFAKEKKASAQWNTLATAHVGMVGINEALRSSKAAKILSDQRVSVETTEVENLMEAIKKGETGAYGADSVEKCVDVGATTTVLVLENLLRDDRIDKILRKAEDQRAKVIVISPLHDAGKKLEALGGLGATLRYKIDES